MKLISITVAPCLLLALAGYADAPKLLGGAQVMARQQIIPTPTPAICALENCHATRDDLYTCHGYHCSSKDESLCVDDGPIDCAATMQTCELAPPPIYAACGFPPP